MIISHKYRCIFIKTAKTAGTSIEVFLSQHCDENDVVTPIWPYVEPHRPRNHDGFYNHIPALEIEQRVSKTVWDTYFKFCVERNPWDKTLSHYHMVNARAGGGITFDDYLSQGAFCINYPKYIDAKGALLVDKIVKYETLMEELGQVFTKLSIPFEGSLGVRAKSEYRSDRRPYRDVLTQEHRDIIAEAFAVEIGLHGYTY